MKASSPSVEQYMTRAPHEVGPKEPLAHARRIMDEHAIRHLPVRDDGKLVGILSERDLQLVWTLAHAPPTALTVEDAMTPDPYAIAPDTPLDRVARVMAERKIGSAVVVEQGRVVGMFTSTDAMKALAEVLAAPTTTPAPSEMHVARPARHERVTTEQLAPDARIRRHITTSARLPPGLSVDDALSAVMCTLVERLTAGEAHELLEALPTAELRPLFEVCALHREGKATAKLHRADFVERVAEHLRVIPAHAELVCAAVFEAVRNELPETLASDIEHQLPRGLQQLWRSSPPDWPSAGATLSAEDARRTVERDVDAAVPLPAQVTSADAFSAVMCAFSERLSAGEAREVVLGLPETLRPLLERCMLHRSEQAAVFGRTELLRRVQDHLHVDARRAEAVVRAVVSAVKRVLPRQAVLDVGSQLPADLLELWAPTT